MTLIGLDVGGTTMKAALVGESAREDGDSRVLASESRPTDRADPVGGVLDFAAHLAARAASLGSPARAAGIALLGIVDEATGTAVHSANVGWRDVPMLRLARERLGIPVAIGHDVRTGGLAEAVLGAGRGAGDFVFVAIGTGIAAALILNGAPYPGTVGWSGEIGHVVVRPGGEPCACGNRGCLETYASAAAVSRRHGEGVPAEEVIARAGRGEEKAGRVWSEALDCLADGLATATLLLDPGLVVMGGGLARAGDALLTPLESRLAARLKFRDPPRVLRTRLDDQAAVKGAAILARRLLDEG
ncbi:ROK family protein [Actinomadura citrea]|jgi:glucokinase|uniref:Glucokinase n=1 Tax=Actinomadura citrea TaxID=46158 RepID=A0A7Y9GIA8_9ACTN|nr:ROK family protein [Actinomadura citrea]NYE16856.1 glucokinase [Actinomadura citrea]GGT58460.1 sugar kinase [Actinomadura citrea]